MVASVPPAWGNGRASSDKRKLENQEEDVRRKHIQKTMSCQKHKYKHSLGSETEHYPASFFVCVCVFVTATAYDFIVQTSHRALKHPLT